MTRHRGFSFIEVLFAVILLGIGFIMIAGVFPAALQQTAATADETQGVLVERGAVRMVQSVATDTLLPSTGGIVVPFMAVQQAAIGQSAFFTADHRMAWSGFYRRNAGDPFAQLIIIALENQNFPSYTTPPPVPPNVAGNAPVAYTITSQFNFDATTQNSSVDLIDTASSAFPPNAVTGAFLIVADDSARGVVTTGSLNGRIFRLGADLGLQNGGARRFQLQPGSDLKDVSDATPSVAVHCYIIGRAPAFNSATPNFPYSGLFTGPNQDIGALSTFIRINEPK